MPSGKYRRSSKAKNSSGGKLKGKLSSKRQYGTYKVPLQYDDVDESMQSCDSEDEKENAIKSESDLENFSTGMPVIHEGELAFDPLTFHVLIFM
jgi:hypothetical protein